MIWTSISNLLHGHQQSGTRFRLRPFDPRTGTIDVGINENGKQAAVNLANVSGVVVGGAPGSGKTAGMEIIVLSLILSGQAHVHIIDGKGGTDWEWAEPASSDCTGDDTTAALTLLERLHDVMRRRISSLRTTYGNSNWWNCPLDMRPPLEVIIIDECQLWFDIRHLTDTSKEHKDACSRILGLATDMVRRGRSAGFVVFALTQKPTSDSLPTSLRDNCGVRICFRVLTSEAGHAVLGDLPGDAPDPTTIPASSHGGAVITTDSGTAVMCRFAYVPEAEAEHLARKYTREISDDKEPPTSGSTTQSTAGS